MKSTIFLFSVLLIYMFCFQGCSQKEAGPNFFGNGSTNDASVLLLDDDPTGLETGAESAFMFDNRGMIYFFALDLSDEQKDAIKEIHQSYRPNFREHHDNWDHSNSSWQEIKAKRDSLHALIYDEIIKLLSEDQLALLNKINEQLENGDYPVELVEHQVAKLDEKLGLTAEQQISISELFSEYGTKILEAREASDDKREFIEIRRALGNELHEKISAFLTDQQFEIYKDLIKSHKRRMHNRGHKHP